jgi:hypothetical protein
LLSFVRDHPVALMTEPCRLTLGKRFFFVKKKQKTFILLSESTASFRPYRRSSRAAAGAK